jgi:hypothetical protein
VKQLDKNTDAKAISLDGIDTTAAWRVECEEPIMESAPDWLEDDHDTGDDTEALDEDVPDFPDFQFHTQSSSVPSSVPQSQSEGDRPGGSTSSGGGLYRGSSSVARGHQFAGSSSRGHQFAGSSSRGRQTPVRGPTASRAPTPSSRGRAISTAITFTRKRGRGNR